MTTRESDASQSAASDDEAQDALAHGQQEQEQSHLRQMALEINEADKLEKFRQNPPTSSQVTPAKTEEPHEWSTAVDNGTIQHPPKLHQEALCGEHYNPGFGRNAQTTTADDTGKAPLETQVEERQADPTAKSLEPPGPPMLQLVPRLPGLTSPQQSLSDVRHPGIGQVVHSRQQSSGLSGRHQQPNNNNDHHIVAIAPGAFGVSGGRISRLTPATTTTTAHGSSVEQEANLHSTGSNTTTDHHPDADNEEPQQGVLLPQTITEEEAVLVEARVDRIGPSVTTSTTPTTTTTSPIQHERAKTRKLVVALVATIVVIAVVVTIVVVVATSGGGNGNNTMATSQEQHTEADNKPEVIELFGETYPIDATTRISRGGHFQPISGSIPSTIGLLTALTYLGLSSHPKLTGTIPTEVGLLLQLTHLAFVDNPNLTGTIPTEVGVLWTQATNKLESLWLQENQLSGSIPSEMGGGGAAVALTKLSMRGNQLSGTIPTEIGLLTTLDTLDLSFNQLSGSLPSEIGLLANLRECGIASNQLTSKIPSEIGFLSELFFLALHLNQLSGSIPSEIGHLSVIDALNFGVTAISGWLPSELALLTSIRYLYLQSTQLAAGNVVPTSLCPNAHTIATDCEKVECPCLGEDHLDLLCICVSDFPNDFYYE